MVRSLGWLPTVDGEVLPSHPFDPAAPLLSAHVPMLIGTNLNEFVHGVDNPTAYSLTSEQLENRLKTQFGERTAIHFARHGDPGHPGLPAWPAVSGGKIPTMIFDTRCRVKEDPEGEGRRVVTGA
jgi:carboxylesterase type B